MNKQEIIDKVKAFVGALEEKEKSYLAESEETTHSLKERARFYQINRVIAGIILCKEFKALKELLEDDSEEEDSYWKDKARGLDADLQELVTAIFKARDLKKLKDTTKLNYSEEWRQHIRNAVKKVKAEKEAREAEDYSPQNDDNLDQENIKSKNQEKLDDGWIKHDGDECPVDGETLVEVRIRDSEEYPQQDRADGWDWNYNGISGDIIAYRIVEEAEERPTLYKYIMDVTRKDGSWRTMDWKLIERASDYIEKYLVK
jgi:hypothetical protein